MKKILIVSILTILAVGFVYFVFDSSRTETAKAGSGDNVSGFAWSENIGWISFNNTSGGGAANYGVNIDPATGNFSGFAWSENIGWISFNESDLAGCPISPCQAKLDFSTKKVSGWAKALTDGGGWDGWIRLKDTNYGVWLDTGVSPYEFRDWAWSDMVIGWLSFNCAERGICGTSNYKVFTSLVINQPPSANNLSVAQPDYCIISWPAAIFSWQFTDPDNDTQSAYQIQVDNNSNFSSPEVDTGKILSSSNSYATLPGKLFWNTTYYWKLKVWDSKDLSSAWISGPSFVTPRHAYPSIDFSWTPLNPTVNENTQFTDQSFVYGGSTKSSWAWTFQDGNPVNSAQQNPIVKFLSAGAKSVTLRVTDSDGFSCQAQKTINSQLPLPDWIEIPPF